MDGLPAKTNDILSYIEQASDLQLNELMCALVHRHKELHSDWDLVFFSLPTNPDLREKEIHAALPLLRSTSSCNKSQ